MADYTISGNVHDVSPDGTPDGLIGWVSPAQDVVQDSGSNSVHVAAKQLEFDADGAFSVDVVEGIYTVSLQFTGPSLAKEQRETKPFEVVADVEIGSVVWRQVEVVTAEFAGTMQDLATQVAEDRAAVEGVVATNDGIMTAVAADDESAFRSEMSEAFVQSGGGGGGVHVDLDTEVRPAQRTHTDVIPVTITGDATITLGATPLSPPRVYLDGLRKRAGTDYSVAGAAITYTSRTAGQVITIDYDYDADTTPTPADVQTNQYALYDTFTRADSTTTVGAAITGQTPTIYNTGVWGISSNQLYRATPATGTDLCVWECGSADGWMEMVLAATGSSSGLGVRATDSGNVLTANFTAFFRRQGSGNNSLGNFSQSFAAGDGQGILMVGSSIKVYRRAGNAGPWVLVGTFTETFQQTSTKHGVRGATATSADRFDNIKFIAGATAPPAV